MLITFRLTIPCLFVEFRVEMVANLPKVTCPHGTVPFSTAHIYFSPHHLFYGPNTFSCHPKHASTVTDCIECNMEFTYMAKRRGFSGCLWHECEIWYLHFSSLVTMTGHQSDIHWLPAATSIMVLIKMVPLPKIHWQFLIHINWKTNCIMHKSEQIES